MALIASLSMEELSVEPGGTVTCEIKVRNRGKIVDEFTFSVVGEAAAWSAVEPQSLSLLPGTDGTAVVSFRPPRSSAVAAGPTPFGVKATSTENEADSTVEEGVLTVGAFQDIKAELVPHTGRGRFKGRYQLAVDNRGNARLNAPIVPADPDAALRFQVSTPSAVVEPGMAGFVKVTVRPRKVFLRGAAQTRAFSLTVTPDGGVPALADGTFLQEAVIPGWAPRAILGALGGLVALVALWLALVKPVIKKEANKQAIAALGLPAGSKLPKPTGTPNPNTGSRGGATTTTAAGGRLIGSTATGPVSQRLSFEPGATTSYVVGANRLLYVTDLVFENPANQTGAVHVGRGAAILFNLAAEHFRDLDYHFVTPIVFSEGEVLNFTAPTCPGCSLYFTGSLVKS